MATRKMNVNKFVTSMLLFNQRKKEWWEPFFYFCSPTYPWLNFSCGQTRQFRLLVRPDTGLLKGMKGCTSTEITIFSGKAGMPSQSGYRGSRVLKHIELMIVRVLDSFEYVYFQFHRADNGFPFLWYSNNPAGYRALQIIDKYEPVRMPMQPGSFPEKSHHLIFLWHHLRISRWINP